MTRFRRDLIANCSKAGVPVMLDAGGEDSPLDDSLLPHLFMIAPNETELANLTGLPTETESQVSLNASNWA